MKIQKLHVIAAATILVASTGLQSSRAQELFPAVFSAVASSTNQGGGIVYTKVTNRSLIKDCAAEQGITNLSGLKLVFDLTSNALQVVQGTNHVVICTPLTFKDTFLLENTNKTKVELLAGVWVETATTSTGTLSATERFAYGSSNQLTGFQLTGRLAYGVAASGTNSTKIVRGVVVAGSDFERDDDDEEGHDD
jgi:hypothetical protein